MLFANGYDDEIVRNVAGVAGCSRSGSFHQICQGEARLWP
jgi:hypothetical protein